MTGKSQGIKQEKHHYQVVKRKLGELLSARVDEWYLETTAHKSLSRRLKTEIEPGRDIVFVYLKKARPDITGFVRPRGLTNFVVIEVKTGEIELDHIYQLKKYRDLLNAHFAFLVSLRPIPEEMKRLASVTHALLHGPGTYETFALAHFHQDSGEFVEWYPKNPFAPDYLWG